MIVRRAVLIALLFSAPLVLTWLMYHVTIYVLDATHRMIEPRVLFYAGAGELAVFFFIGILEVKDRW